MHTTVRVHHLHRYIGYLNSLNRSTLSIKETRNTVLWLTMLYQKMDRQADLWLSSTSLCQFPFLCYLHVSLLLNNTVPQYKYYNSKQVLGYTTLIFNTVITSRGGGGNWLRAYSLYPATSIGVQKYAKQLVLHKGYLNISKPRENRKAIKCQLASLRNFCSKWQRG